MHPFSAEELLGRLSIEAMNDMQRAAMTAFEQPRDIILLSATGSGKTLAFLLPIVMRLEKKRTTQALIITPSRELALQIEKVFRSLQTGFKVTCCYGGHLRETEENNLVEPPALLIGTPGRLADHIRRNNITTDTISLLVLDEFDKSLEAGFEEEMSFIISSLPAIGKRVLTSATDAIEVPAFVNISDPLKLDFLQDAGSVRGQLDFQFLRSDAKDKLETLFELVCYLGGRSTVVFSNHRESVARISEFLKSKSITNVYYHGAMEQRERDTALFKFRNGTSNLLITTDLAARGLDIPHIRYIVHYHLPHTKESFIHRNGRTARMEASGTAILLIGPDETMPAYAGEGVTEISLPPTAILPEKPKWTTLFIAAGKKDKINKVDIVGFLSKQGALKREDIGLIEVKDFFSFAAVRRTKAGETLRLVQGQKIKNQKVKIEIAK